jgi:pyruvate dehydrogenase E2 component (dihydrolipoamide acetyltransferase)
MTASKKGIPHFYVSTDIVMDPALHELQMASERPDGPRVTVTALLVHRLAAALRAHPEFNALMTEEGTVIVDRVNVAVAVALDGGLVAPAIVDCARMDLIDVAQALEDLVGRARAGHLKAAELTAGTFTLSNLGMFPVTQFTAIVTPPQVAILAVGRVTERPVVRSGTLGVAKAVTVTLSADHRAVDGAQAGRFLATFKGLVEGSSGR